MSAKDAWKANETRTLVWRLIQAAGEAGIGRSALVEKSGKSGTAVDWHLTNLARDRYIQRPEGQMALRWVTGPVRPPIDGVVLELALEAIEDCPQGVQEQVLRQSIGCGLRELHDAMAAAERAGVVERIAMPPQHGGGVGWCLPGSGPGAAPPSRLQELPVLEVDIDRIHRVHKDDVFAADVKDGCLSITSSTHSLVLSQRHTQKLLTFLLFEAPR